MYHKRAGLLSFPVHENGVDCPVFLFQGFFGPTLMIQTVCIVELVKEQYNTKLEPIWPILSQDKCTPKLYSRTIFDQPNFWLDKCSGRVLKCEQFESLKWARKWPTNEKTKQCSSHGPERILIPHKMPRHINLVNLSQDNLSRRYTMWVKELWSLSLMIKWGQIEKVLPGSETFPLLWDV